MNQSVQIDHVVPLPTPRHELPVPSVILRISDQDVGRILRALEHASVQFAHEPAGARAATTYRSLARKVKDQTEPGADFKA